MQALRKKGNNYFIHYFLVSLLCSSQSLTMEQQKDPWPTITLVHNQSPTTYTLGSVSFSIVNGGIRHTIPVSERSEELSPIQQIRQILIEKDRAEHKEDDTFTVLNSRYIQFVEQREHILDTCIECLHNSTDAKLQLVNLSFDIMGEEELSTRLNKIFHNYLHALVTTFYTPDGQLKRILSYDYDTAARRIGNLLVELLRWEECLPKIEEYKEAEVPGFEKFYDDVHSPWADFKGAYQAVADNIKTLFRSKQNFTEFKQCIISNPFNQDLIKLSQAYKISDYAGARAIITKYRDKKVAQKRESTALQAMDLSCLVDSYSRELSQSVRPLKKLQAVQQKHTESPLIQQISLQTKRYVKRNATLGSQVDTVKFLITTLHRIPPKRLKKKDSPLDKEFAQVYDTFFDQRGLPVIFEYNETVLKTVTIPPSVGNYGNIKERLNLYKLASLCIKPEFINQKTFHTSVAHAIQYLCHALRDKDHAQTYHLLTEALYNALTNESNHALRDSIAHCNFLPSEQYAHLVHDSVLEHVRTLLQALDEPVSMDQEMFLHNALLALSRVWAQARDGSDEAKKLLEKSTPTTALVEENFLNHSLDYENALITSQYMQQRMNELGFNRLLTANAYAISAPALKKYEARCKLMEKHNAVPNFTTITAIMHDAYTPRPIVSLLHDALELWNIGIEAKSKEVRGIAITVTECAEVAYDYHQEGDEYYKAYVKLGRGLCKYGLIVANVIGRKFTNLAHGTATATSHCVIWSIKSAAQTTQLLLDNLEIFTNGISGKGFYLPRDYFKQQELLENPPDPQLQREKMHEEHEAILATLNMVGHGTQRAFAFVAHLAGITVPDNLQKMNFETQQAVLAYIDKFNALSPEEKFEQNVEFILDWIICDKVFSIGSQLFKLLRMHIKELAALQKMAIAAQEVECCEYALEHLYNAEVELAGIAEKELIPTIMKAQGVPGKAVMSAKAPAASILKHFLQDIVDFELIYGKQAVDEVMQIVRWDLPGTFNKVYNYRIFHNAPKSMSEFVETMVKYIMEIDAQGLKSYRFENGICNLTTIEEARAAIACQKQGLLKNLIRDIRRGMGDFIETGINQTWDVKTAKSFALNGEPIFQKKRQIEAFIDSLKFELTKPTNENLIISIGELETSSHGQLYAQFQEKFSKAELQRMLIIDEFNPSNSKTTQELLEFLGHK